MLNAIIQFALKQRLLIVALAIPLFIEKFRWKLQLGFFIIFGYPIIAFFLFSGGVLSLEPVETSRWGGLTLTLVLASVGMAASSSRSSAAWSIRSAGERCSSLSVSASG